MHVDSLPPTIHSIRPPAVARRMAVRTLRQASVELRRTIHRLEALEAGLEERAVKFRHDGGLL